jgi:hypothetical protein
MAKGLKATAALLGALLLFGGALAGAEVDQNGHLRVSFEGKIAPHSLPRTGLAPVAVTLAGKIKTTDGAPPPQLRTVTLAINQNGRLDYRGLATCNYHQIQPASSLEAKEACRRSLVGSGSLKANVALPDQSPFPSNGKVLAFNGNLHGKPVIYVHIYGTEPLPQSNVLTFAIRRSAGAYGTTLVAQLPKVAAEWGYVSGLSLSLNRKFRYKGETRSFLSAGCPAPKGFPGTTFAFAKATFGFEDGRTLSSTLNRSCKVRR